MLSRATTKSMMGVDVFVMYYLRVSEIGRGAACIKSQITSLAKILHAPSVESLQFFSRGNPTMLDMGWERGSTNN